MASRGLDDEGVDEHAASTALALARRRERKRANADACRTRQKASGVPVSSAILSKTRERSPREAAAYRVRQCEKAATRGKPVGPDKDGGPLSRAPSSAAGPVGGAAVDLVLVSDGDGPTGHAGRFTLTAHIADAGTVVPAGGASDLPAPTAAITLGVAGPVNVDEAEDVDRAAVVPAAVDALPKKCFQYCHNNPGAQQARRFDENGTTPSVMSTVPDAQLRGLYTGGIARACTGFGKVARWTPL
ncbi:hypothetical protein I4F81_008620 [Pyropia yezoensis]|uniref:Uncharacterized protein n=1 Tax=Pyropia yezoensis TaxID=2788 RepID=A0ACC3C7A7_PYRYE|nr:hypothetical protein I4F81_008620 [Neopyropia yezoensis]